MPHGDDLSTMLGHVQPLSGDDRWYELLQTIDQLGGYESWPDADDVGSWLAETVVPQLEWLLGKHAEKVRTVLADMEKVAKPLALPAQPFAVVVSWSVSVMV